MSEGLQYNEIVNEISLLYELSLSVGNSLDLHENCDKFISKLLSRNNLNFASVWIKESSLNFRDSDNIQVVYSYPHNMVSVTQLPVCHSVFSLSDTHETVALNSLDERFKSFVTEKDVFSGTYFIFSLGDIGILSYIL